MRSHGMEEIEATGVRPRADTIAALTRCANARAFAPPAPRGDSRPRGDLAPRRGFERTSLFLLGAVAFVDDILVTTTGP